MMSRLCRLRELLHFRLTRRLLHLGKCNSEAMEKAMQTEKPDIAAAVERMADDILHASAAWGSDMDGAAMNEAATPALAFCAAIAKGIE